jgi:hypothetical protein
MSFSLQIKLKTSLSDIVKDGPQEVDMLQWCARVAVELIGQGGLGWSFGDLDGKSEPHPYPKTVKNFGYVTLDIACSVLSRMRYFLVVL